MTLSTTPSTGVEAGITLTPLTITSLSMTKRTMVPGLIFAKGISPGVTIRIAASVERVICEGIWGGGVGWDVVLASCCAACWAISSGERKIQRADGKSLRIIEGSLMRGFGWGSSFETGLLRENEDANKDRRSDRSEHYHACRGFAIRASKRFGRSAAPDSHNSRVVNIGRPSCIAELDLEQMRSDAGDLALEVDPTLLADANPLTDAKFQDMRANHFRLRVSRLRRPCCWGKDCKDRDDSNPASWCSAQEV